MLYNFVSSADQEIKKSVVRPVGLEYFYNFGSFHLLSIFFYFLKRKIWYLGNLGRSLCCYSTVTETGHKHSHGNTNVKQYSSFASMIFPSTEESRHENNKTNVSLQNPSCHCLTLESYRITRSQKLTLMWYFIDLQGWILFSSGFCLPDVDDRVQRQLQSGVGAAETLQPDRCLPTQRGMNPRHPTEEWSPPAAHRRTTSNIWSHAVSSSRKENQVKSTPTLSDRSSTTLLFAFTSQDSGLSWQKSTLMMWPWA